MCERKCIICGADISHRKKNAILCEKKSCENKYRKIRLTNKSKRYCEVCGDDISNLPSQRRICLKEECIAEQKRRKYKESLKEKICQYCGEKFYGTLRQVNCEKCCRKKNIEYEIITRPIKCKHCGKIIRYEEIKLASKTNIEQGKTEVCEECKKKNYEKSSIRMKNNNPSYNYENVLKGIKTREVRYGFKRKPKKKGETKEEMRLRMKTNNPMQREEVRNKVADTLRKKYKEGKLKKYFGKDNWNWKGNRQFNKAVRIALRRWVKMLFEETNYTCQKCGKINTELHVHHLLPLRTIIKEELENENITIEYINKIEGTEEYYNIINKIVQFHYEHKDIGIVVCPDCHEILDNFYKCKKKNENTKNRKKSF